MNAECEIKKAVFQTPFGWAGVAGSDKGVCRVVLPRKEKKAVEKELANAELAPLERCVSNGVNGVRNIGGFEQRHLNKAAKLLRRYFSGRRVLFDLTLDLRYYTGFQRAVWKEAVSIPFGETRSYAWIAKRIGRPNAARAVGNALGANPAPVIIPCHRVVSSSGGIGGFSGGPGLKKKLLDLEKDRIGRG